MKIRLCCSRETGKGRAGGGRGGGVGIAKLRRICGLGRRKKYFKGASLITGDFRGCPPDYAVAMEDAPMSSAGLPCQKGNFAANDGFDAISEVGADFASEVAPNPCQVLLGFGRKNVARLNQAELSVLKGRHPISRPGCPRHGRADLYRGGFWHWPHPGYRGASDPALPEFREGEAALPRRLAAPVALNLFSESCLKRRIVDFDIHDPRYFFFQSNCKQNRAGCERAQPAVLRPARLWQFRPVFAPVPCARSWRGWCGARCRAGAR